MLCNYVVLKRCCLGLDLGLHAKNQTDLCLSTQWRNGEKRAHHVLEDIQCVVAIVSF